MKTMSNVFSTHVDIQKGIENACENALIDVSNHYVSELENYIKEDFYNVYKPKIYNRTYSFLKSPATKMLSGQCAEVYINTDVMHYLGISGEDVAYLASKGYHGSEDIFREGYFWEDFITYVNISFPTLMKQALKRQGLVVK